MKWRGRKASGNVEDRRGLPAKGLVGGGIGTVVLVIAALVFGVDPGALMQAAGGGGAAPEGAGTVGAPTDEAGRFAAVVLAETDSTWSDVFAAAGQDYPEPTMVLFSDAVASACGTASSAVGPFYCPRDARIYLDLSFFDALARRFGAAGDFAQAYVVAHEVGHHVQNVTGRMEGFAGYTESGPDSRAVRMELQADCYAGIFAGYVRGAGLLEAGDIDEALDAAAAIGDDAIQRRTQGTIVPESFTHGTSAQRARWFRTGYETGDVSRCDTFAAPSL